MELISEPKKKIPEEDRVSPDGIKARNNGLLKTNSAFSSVIGQGWTSGRRDMRGRPCSRRSRDGGLMSLWLVQINQPSSLMTSQILKVSLVFIWKD